jgi:hypothetical protein
MKDDVEVVGDDPVPLVRPFEGAGPELVLCLQPPPHFINDRLRLAWVSPGAEDEEVGVRADRPQVEDDDVLRQLLLGKAGDEASLFERGQSGRVLSSLLRSILSLPCGVEPPALDLSCNQGVNHVVDRLAACDAAADLRR